MRAKEIQELTISPLGQKVGSDKYEVKGDGRVQLKAEMYNWKQINQNVWKNVFAIEEQIANVSELFVDKFDEVARAKEIAWW